MSDEPLGAHVDFEQIGSAVVTLQYAAGRYEATGIQLPTPYDEAWIVRIDAGAPLHVITAVWEANRLLSLPRAAAGALPIPDSGGQLGDILPLSELGVSASAYASWGLGHTMDDELLVVAGNGRGEENLRVTVWHLRPQDIDAPNLAAPLTARVLPTPTPATEGYYVRQTASGYELIPPVEASPGGGAYATAADYRARTDAGTAVPDDLLAEQLAAASRIVDQELRVAPRHFTPHTERYVFSGGGGAVLWLRDEAGFAYGLRSVVAGGIRPDYAYTGRYDQEAWDLDDVWVWPRPRNGAQLGVPYHALELRLVGAAPMTVWPWVDGSVSIEGEWGWATTPGAIRELTVHVARDLRDSLRAGAAGRVETIDDGLVYRDDTWRLWREVKRRYGRDPGLVR